MRASRGVTVWDGINERVHLGDKRLDAGCGGHLDQIFFFGWIFMFSRKLNAHSSIFQCQERFKFYLLEEFSNFSREGQEGRRTSQEGRLELEQARKRVLYQQEQHRITICHVQFRTSFFLFRRHSWSAVQGGSFEQFFSLLFYTCSSPWTANEYYLEDRVERSSCSKDEKTTVLVCSDPTQFAIPITYLSLSSVFRRCWHQFIFSNADIACHCQW